jgi:MFS family permease
MFLYIICVIGLQITVWVVPSLIENAVAVSIIGLLLGEFCTIYLPQPRTHRKLCIGPMYPMLMNHMTRILPRWLLTGAMGWVSGVGTTGSAALPFLTGIMAAKFGIRSLQPLYVPL